MQLKRFVGTGLAIVALVVGMVGCGGGGGDDDDDAIGGVAVVVAKSDPNPRFEPKQLKARVGSEVSLAVKNEGNKVHNFTLSYLGVDQDIPPGQTVQVKFTVTEPPKGVEFFTFYDKNFQGEGMQGRLNVEK